MIGRRLLLSLVPVAALACSSCVLIVNDSLERELDAGDADAGVRLPPSPADFDAVACDAKEGSGATITPGVGWEDFVPALGVPTMSLEELPSGTYVYVSLRTEDLALSDVCVEVRLDVAEENQPNEVVGIARYRVDLDERGDGTGEVLGIPVFVENPPLISGKRGLLLIDVRDDAGAGDHVETFVRVE